MEKYEDTREDLAKMSGQQKECCHCEKDFISYGGVIYCDSCRWDLHYSRNWYKRDYTKEEWMNEQRRHRVIGYRGRFKE